MNKKADADTVQLQDGRTIRIHTWPMRPGLRHVATLQAILNTLDLEKIEKLEGLDVINAIDVAQIAEKFGERILDLIVDGTDLDSEQAEKLSIVDMINLATAISALNVHPMMGLFDKMKKSNAKSTKPPQS